MKDLKETKGNKIMKGIIKITKHKLFKNKLYSILMILLGIIGSILTKNIFVLFIILLFAIPVFFSKENVIV